MTTIEVIKAHYPHPVTAAADMGSSDDDCVGGAACLYFRYLEDDPHEQHFPERGPLADVLRSVNPNLDVPYALSLALAITECNDNEDFAGAWDALESALTSRKE